MGAHQSVPGAGHSAAPSAAKACYYELIGVERDATDVEIKKAYRKKALELHPDRNLNDVQEATRKFAEVQAAYEILSDPQERAWYDSHRDAIISGADDPGSGADPATFHNVSLTSTEEILDLIRKFNSTIPFNDEPTGFFGVLREKFEHLALEEETAAEMAHLDCPVYSTFGASDDNYDTVVKPFYASWLSFATLKSFSWKDKYRLSDAPDRRVRRLMEKENKKCREEAIRDFNEAIRFLVTFVRKRDPRYIPNTQTDNERQKHLRDAAASQAARSRAENQRNIGTYQGPDWTQSQDDDAHDDYFSEIEQDSEIEILECVVCNKTFKSIQQLEVHEKSKKHIKALQLLRNHMKKEGMVIGLDSESIHGSKRSDDVPESITSPRLDGSVLAGVQDTNKASKHPTETEHFTEEQSHEHWTSPSRLDESESDEYAPRNLVEKRFVSEALSKSPQEADGSLVASLQDISLETSPSAPRSKIGAAKAKRQKKAARQSSAKDIQCHVCSAPFVSRTKLFDHIRQENHATAPGAKTPGK